MRTATELLAELIAIYEDKEKDWGDVMMWLHRQREEVRRRLSEDIDDLDLLREQTEHWGEVDRWAWKKVVRVGRRIVSEVYPPEVFTGSSGDTGPLYIVALRAALEAIDESEGIDRARGEGE